MPAMTRSALSMGACASLVAVEAGETHESQAHQAGGDHGDGGALEGVGDVGALQALPDPGEEDQRQGEANGTAEAEQQGLHQVVAQPHVEQGNAQHRAVGGDEGQVNPQHLMQHRAGLLDHQFGELHDGCDHHDEGQGAQIAQVEGGEQVMVDQVAGAAAQGEHEGGGGTADDKQAIISLAAWGHSSQGPAEPTAWAQGGSPNSLARGKTNLRRMPWFQPWPASGSTTTAVP